jgi:hypothetical protein
MTLAARACLSEAPTRSAPVQGELPFGSIWPVVTDVDRARALVAYVLRQRVCARCCGDARLVFLHRRAYTRWDAPVARLVQLGAASTRLREEMGKCDVFCRRCALAAVAPKMLGCGRRRPVGVVAKGRACA